ncbi:MAG: hypothetical protein Q9O62_14755 [Ardenticatenia bacterium]|nr:hypothetical protein [Ardenticatenia bacterium]
MTLTHPLTIVLVLLGGSLLIPRTRPWVSRPARSVLTLVLMGVAFFLGLLALSEVPLVISLSHWEDFTGTDEAIVFHFTELTGRWMLLVLYAGLAVTLAALDEPWEGPTDEYVSVLAGVSAALMVFSMAGNFTTWLAAWALLDLFWLFAVGLPGRSRWPWALGVLQGIGMFALLGATLLVWRMFRVVSFTLESMPLLAVVFISAALIVRTAPYPLHLPALAHNEVPSRIRAFFPLVSVAASGFWLIFWMSKWGTAWLTVAWEPVLAVLLVATGFLAWRRPRATQRVIFLNTWLVLLVLWALWTGHPGRAGQIIWGGALSLAALALHGGEGERLEVATLPTLLAAFVFLGIPGSGLAVVGELIAEAVADGRVGLGVAGILGLMGITAAIIHQMAEPKPSQAQPSRWAGITLLAVGAWPPFGRTLWLVPPFVEQSPPAVPWTWWMGMLVFGWAGGLLLWRLRRVWARYPSVMRGGVMLLGLEWAWDGVGHAGRWLAVFVRGAVRIVEGENYGWLLLFLFIAFVLLFR